MKNFTLYIGNKNYSSWSLRGWLALKFVGVEFEEIKLSLFTPKFFQEILKLSPSGKVPCLHHGNIVIWDTIAIIEYLNEIFPNSGLYPKDPVLRSIARSCIAEMHSSFLSLRLECPMNIKRDKFKNVSKDTIQDLQRIYEIWDYCKEYSKSDKFLLGNFSAIDIFFVPVVSRIISYKLDQKNHEEYINSMSHHAFFEEWKSEAMGETEKIDHAEVD